MKSIRVFLFSVLAAAFLIAGAQFAMAQTAETGALAGTVTDPSGGVVAGASITITNTGTGQARTATTDSNGSYKFSLLPPGNYSVKFSSPGFQTAEVPSVTVNVTETAVLNHALQVGGQSIQVTVEATTQAIQTENVTNGGVVTGDEITSLPLVSRNYTQIINLSPGVVANAATASSIGNGTQDVSANGSTANENNYSMNGASLVNYVSGMAAQEGSFPGIAIPNPDAIEEFKVQTSQYDASSGRNPGANVEVVTKTGSNNFHGRAWEFNRNNFFNGNDFFFKRSEAALGEPNKPQTLKQNTFGFTLGGPIKKNKAHFFGSYQGFRQLNGIGTSGFASGYAPNVQLLPWNDYADFASGVCSDLRCTNNVAAYKTYLGSVFGTQTGFLTFLGGTGLPATSANITNTAVALLQAKGTVKGGFNQGFYFPAAPQSCALNPITGACGPVAISDPTRANEDQYIINGDYSISQKNTLYARYLYQRDPQLQPFNCFILAGNCNPGAPINAYYGNHIAQLQLTSVLTPNLVNQARADYHRDIENNTDPNLGVQSCSLPNGGTIIPLVNNGAPCGSAVPALAKQFPEMLVVPQLDILGIGGAPWSQGGNFSMISSNFINTFQWSDQVSWNHGIHSLRFGFEGNRVLYNNTIPSSGRGELLMYSTADFLTSSSGLAVDGTPVTPTGGIALGFGLKGTLTHYNRVNQFDWYIQDDIKLTPKLTLNAGVRWEFAGYPDDKSGQFSNVWASQLTKINTGSAFASLGNTGTLVGFAVPSNFAVKTFGLTAPSGANGVLVNGNKTLVPGTPWKDFAPRIGVAWQPIGQKLVVRAGYGWFYDTIYGNLLIDNQLNLPPYSGAGGGPAPLNQENTLHAPWRAGVGPLVWTPRYMFTGLFDPNTGALCPAGICSSGLGYTSDSPQLADRLPLIQEYNLDLQYEFAHGWVADVGYVGSHGIHLYDWSRNVNIGRLVAGAPNNPTAASGFQNMEMIASSLPYNDPANPTPITTNTIGTTTSNLNERVSYLGFSPAGVAETNTLGDHLYNSLQAQLRHQFSNGLLLQAAYTWSKEFTNINTSAAGSGIQPPGEVIFGAANSNDPLDLRQQYGLAAFNRSQRGVITYVYNLPYHKTEGLSGKLLGGWTFSGVTTIQNGLPFWIVDGGGGSIYGAGLGGSRAALADPVDCNPKTGSCKSGIPIATSGSNTSRATSHWVNPSAFVSLSPSTYAAPNPALPFGALPASSPYCIGGTPNPGLFGPPNPNEPCGQNPVPPRAPGTFGPGDPGAPADPGAPFLNAGSGFGNTAIGSITGPGQFNFDMSLIKTTKLWEGGTLEFHVDAFNVFNHAQFNPPGNDVNAAATFGIITSTSVTPRVMQFGLKFLF
ncbi:MAG TPA: carboxypeptidase regulatory-like domain-containing protein [Verrucomicrobiae bacterium]|nr:carboxypeptidase regulatory-like domain-containing protein [Verrucomicrobiae bacterium]